MEISNGILWVFVVTWVLGDCGAVKQWEMTSLLCAHSLPANRAFQNRKSGWSTRSFFWFGKRSTINGWNGIIRTVPGLQKQLQTALILSVTFIWSYLWVSLNGLGLYIYLDLTRFDSCKMAYSCIFCNRFARLNIPSTKTNVLLVLSNKIPKSRYLLNIRFPFIYSCIRIHFRW